MAVRHEIIDREPAAVWAVLSEPGRYADWVVGTADSAPSGGSWPRTGSTLTYTVHVGRRTLHGETVVRRHAPPRWLELEAKTGIGTARIALDIRPWGDSQTLVIVDEHPLRGAAGALHNAAFDIVLQLRHRTMLRRLAELVERHAVEPPRSAEPPPPAAYDGAPESAAPPGTTGPPTERPE